MEGGSAGGPVAGRGLLVDEEEEGEAEVGWSDDGMEDGEIREVVVEKANCAQRVKELSDHEFEEEEDELEDQEIQVRAGVSKFIDDEARVSR